MVALTTTVEVRAHPFPLPPCLTSAGVAVVVGDAASGTTAASSSPPLLLPPGLHAWAEARSLTSSSCPPAAVDTAWQETVAALVVLAFNHPVGGVLTPVRLPLGGQGRAVLLTRSTTGALTTPAASAWRRAAGGEGGSLPDVDTLISTAHAAAWAGLGVSLERRRSGGGGVAATFSARALGPAPPPTPSPLLPACPARVPALSQRLVGGANSVSTTLLVVEAVVDGSSTKACVILQAPFPFRLGRPSLTPCYGGALVRLEPGPPFVVHHRQALDAPDTAVFCFEPEEQRTCVVASAPLTRLTPLAGASVGLRTDRHARVPVPPAVLVIEGDTYNKTMEHPFFGPFSLQAGDRAVLFATSADPAGVRPSVVDETAADVVLSLTGTLWAVLAAAMLQASRGERRRTECKKH